MSDLTLEELAPIKLIVLGDTGVGKSSILANFNNEKFNSCRQPTLGSAFFSKRQTLSNGTTIEFHVVII
jgi:GTPase SAR1 family protein